MDNFTIYGEISIEHDRQYGGTFSTSGTKMLFWKLLFGGSRFDLCDMIYTGASTLGAICNANRTGVSVLQRSM